MSRIRNKKTCNFSSKKYLFLNAYPIQEHLMNETQMKNLSKDFSKAKKMATPVIYIRHFYFERFIPLSWKFEKKLEAFLVLLLDFSKFSQEFTLVIMNTNIVFHPWKVNRAKLKYAFINVIRDPIDHLVSQWYFSQSGTPFSKDSDSRKTNENIKSIDLCVADQDEFCKNGGSWERDKIFNSQSCWRPLRNHFIRPT